MKFSCLPALVLVVSLNLACPGAEQVSGPDENIRIFSGALSWLVKTVSPSTNAPAGTFTATLKLSRGGGLAPELLGSALELAYQAPDHLRLSSAYAGNRYIICRDGQQLWVYVPGKRFGLIGSPDVAPFSSAPGKKDTTALGPLKLPVPAEQILMLPFVVDLKPLPAESVNGTVCAVLSAVPKPEAVRGFNLPEVTLQLWIRTNDLMPLKIGYKDPRKGADLEIEIADPQVAPVWAEAKWKLESTQGDHIESVARSHLTKFLKVALAKMNEQIPTLGPATGERRVVAREGKGRLEMVDGTRVLILQGTPEEMGRQHGTLLKKEIRDLVDHILYGVGVGSSVVEGRWFFGEIEKAQKRLDPFMDERYFREMDALAAASGIKREEIRLANFFPELFHCSGFALFGKATEDGRLYHGRVLDYLRGMGLEQNSVLVVFKPDQGNAWANVGYAGFVGSVTAMNEKRIAMGEMGGRGEGNWDGKPMAELLREVMEKANTLDEAVEIMRKGPRTCEYYYVISDAKSRRAVGIAATPSRFEVVQPGQAHPLLPHPVQDAVLMSAGDRYEELARRVQEGFGKFGPDSARDLMKRPVAMKSNLHCALFAPETLDIWVATADAKIEAAGTRYTHYNLAELLQDEKP